MSSSHYFPTSEEGSCIDRQDDDSCNLMKAHAERLEKIERDDTGQFAVAGERVKSINKGTALLRS